MERDARLKKVIALVPAFNEELTIASVVLMSVPYVWKVIVVDDGSKDRTSEIAAKAGAMVIQLPKNTGKAAALRRGFEECKKFDPDCVVTIDGDGQMDPSLIPNICRPVLDGEADLVIGSRYLERTDIPKYRKMGLLVLNSTTNLGSMTKVTDSQSGYRALSRNALEHVDFRSDSYSVESDMIIHFSNKGLKITEVPTTVRYDVPNGHKKNPLKHGMSVLAKLIGFVGYKRPLLLFGVPGIAFFLAGTILSFATFLNTKLIFDWTLVTQGIAGISLFGTGLFLIFTSLVLNSLGILMDKLR
ncbi:MAG: glycosyltransferase family 2 protein [Methanomassiliicoccales archaeon]|nr:MAG: glycosyltransferase family 2 protein [Methanomassiliicoccales archaeon]